MITTQYMTSFTPEEMQLMIEQGNAKDARIAELEFEFADARDALTRIIETCNDDVGTDTQVLRKVYRIAESALRKESK